MKQYSLILTNKEVFYMSSAPFFFLISRLLYRLKSKRLRRQNLIAEVLLIG